jgi:hypothetical protein
VLTTSQGSTPITKGKESYRKYRVLARGGEIGTLMHGCWGCKTEQLLWKRAEAPLKIKSMIASDPAVPLLSVDAQEQKAWCPRGVCTPAITAHYSQNVEIAQVSAENK